MQGTFQNIPFLSPVFSSILECSNTFHDLLLSSITFFNFLLHFTECKTLRCTYNKNFLQVYMQLFILSLGHIQSLPKVLEHLQYFLDHLINTPLSPSEQCWFMEDIHAAHTSIYVEITLIDVSVQLNIVLRGQGMVILCFRPET